MATFKIVKINSKYCNYLRKFDNKVAFNAGSKELRPFIGILFKVNEYEYFAPLSSPKAKHLKMKNKIDFIKIDSGKLGAVNFNNMIPVQKTNYELIDINKQDIKYQLLLQSQLMWLNRNNSSIRGKALNLYNKYKTGKLPENILNVCCNFTLLEQKCEEFNK